MWFIEEPGTKEFWSGGRKTFPSQPVVLCLYFPFNLWPKKKDPRVSYNGSHKKKKKKQRPKVSSGYFGVCEEDGACTWERKSEKDRAMFMKKKIMLAVRACVGGREEKEYCK